MITHHLSFGTFFIHTNYMVGEFAPGVEIDVPMSLDFMALAQEHFVGPYVYIGNRINSYSIDPCVYRVVPPPENFKGFGAVTYRPATYHAVQVERNFLPDIPLGIFFNINDAVNWAQNILRQPPVSR